MMPFVQAAGIHTPMVLTVHVSNAPPASARTAADTLASPIFSHCIVSGHQVYLAGQVGVDSKGNYVEGTIKDRTKALLERVNEKLGHVGCDLGDSTFIRDLFRLLHSVRCRIRLCGTGKWDGQS
jgi:enamine deaminase RidA (YjgF/YER057c/UK114 family)